jgi:chromosome segregation ATPase
VQVDATFVQTVISLLSFFGVIFLSYVNLRTKAEQAQQKLEIKDELNRLQHELNKRYVPVEMDSLQHQTIAKRFQQIDAEIEKNRARIHDLSGKFTELIMGKLDRIEVQLQDKVRRMTNIDSRIESIDKMMHEFSNRILDMERGKHPR